MLYINKNIFKTVALFWFWLALYFGVIHNLPPIFDLKLSAGVLFVGEAAPHSAAADSETV